MAENLTQHFALPLPSPGHELVEDVQRLRDALTLIDLLLDDRPTKSGVMAEISRVIGTAPDALNALNELASAINNDPSFAATIAQQLSEKVGRLSPELLGTPTTTTPESGNNSKRIANAEFVQGEIAYASSVLTATLKALMNGGVEGNLSVKGNNKALVFDYFGDGARTMQMWQGSGYGANLSVGLALQADGSLKKTHTTAATLNIGADGTLNLRVDTTTAVGAAPAWTAILSVSATGEVTSPVRFSAPAFGSSDGKQAILFDATLKRPVMEVQGFRFDFMGGHLLCINKGRQIYGGESGTAGTFVVPAGVYFIFVKMWGAGGGGGAYGSWRQGSRGGAGGYSHGLIPVVPGETITYRVGQRGYARWGANKAYPDGGGASLSGGDNQYAATGGGSTSIHVPSLGGWVMFAGGGGGGGCVNGYACNNGGAGGGLAGESALLNHYNGSNNGRGGSQTAGGAGGTGAGGNGANGAYMQGGTFQATNCYGGGGGGGYYGGGAGGYNNSNSMGAGGGGSGYVHPNIIMGMTIGGSGATPGMAGDPDLSAANGGGAWPCAIGGDEDGQGGSGLLAIYY